MKPSSLKEAIQGFERPGSGIVTGRVLNVLPVKIQLINDMKSMLGERSLIISQRMRDLQDGEQVYLLQTGDKYYVLDRM